MPQNNLALKTKTYKVGQTAPPIVATAPLSFGDISGWTVTLSLKKGTGVLPLTPPDIFDGPNRIATWILVPSNLDVVEEIPTTISYVDLAGKLQYTETFCINVIDVHG